MPNSDPVNILLVDDRLDGLFTLEAVLKCPRYNLVKATSGREALAAILQYDFAVILLDVQMPGMDGYEATRRLREIAPELPVIGQTAHAMFDDRQRCLDSGMVDYLAKPVDVEALVEALLKHTAGWRARTRPP